MIARSKALFTSLEKHNVRYVVIGGIAAILHGVPRMTGDIDLFIETTKETIVVTTNPTRAQRRLPTRRAPRIQGGNDYSSPGSGEAGRGD